MISFSMLNGFFDPITNFFNNFFTTLFYRIYVLLYYLIIGAIGKICDVCQMLFRSFAGLGDFELEGIDVNIVVTVFVSMLVLAVVLLLVAVFVATLKTEWNADGNNSKKKVFKNALRAIVNFVTVPVCCVLGLIVSTALLKSIDAALQVSSSTTSLTGQIFCAGGYSANRVRSYEGTADNPSTYPENSMAYFIDQGYGNFGIFTRDESGFSTQSIADKIDDAFGRNLKVSLSNMDEKARTLVYIGGEYSYAYGAILTGAGNTMGYFPWGHYYFNGFKIFDNTDGESHGYIVLNEKANGNSNGELTFSIYNIGLVSYFYDISPLAFDYIITTIALIFCAYTYVITCLGLIKRMFMLVTLLIISPPICALYPLDNGQALGKWRGAFVKELLSAYSVVVVMNIFLMLLPLILSINFISKTNFFETIGVGTVTYIAKILIVLGALTFFKDATKIISDIIGAGNAYDDGDSHKKQFASNVKKVAGAVAMVAGGAAALAGAGGAAGALKGAGKAVPKAPGLENAAKNAMPKQGVDDLANRDVLSGKATDNASAGGGEPMNPSPDNTQTDAGAGNSDGIAIKGLSGKILTSAARGNKFSKQLVDTGRFFKGAASSVNKFIGRTFKTAVDIAIKKDPKGAYNSMASLGKDISEANAARAEKNLAVDIQSSHKAKKDDWDRSWDLMEEIVRKEEAVAKTKKLLDSATNSEDRIAYENQIKEDQEKIEENSKIISKKDKQRKYIENNLKTLEKKKEELEAKKKSDSSK